ncbi:MAG: glutathione S-transferase C-terminal domain-containing protein, partial [Candidatus Binatia bacterium]
FLSALIEEYADEWGNKPMFHYRWTYEADQQAAGDRLARSMMPHLGDAEVAGAIEMIKTRMVPRLRFVGSTPETLEAIEGSYRRQLAILEPHLARRPYLFGGRPALADFGLAGQLYECSIDPTPAAILAREAPHAKTWIERMLEPRVEGDFESWPTLRDGLTPLLRDEVGAVFLPWSDANARALAAGEKTFSLTLGGHPFSQDAQKFHARSLGALRERYARVADRSALEPILAETGCLRWLTA